MSRTPGIIPQISGFLVSDRFWAATVFIDHATSYMYTHLQRDQILIESIEAIAAYEIMAATFGIRVKKIHTDNRILAEKGFKSNVSDNNQTISYCGVVAHFQNGIAEADIKKLTEKANTMLIHANHQWPEFIQPCLQTFALKQAEFNMNNLCLRKNLERRAPKF